MRIFSIALFLCFSVSAHAQWSVGMTKTSETSISFYSDRKEVVEGNNFRTLDEALLKLVKDNGVKQLHYISVHEFFKQQEFHDELLAQFQKLLPEKT